MQKTLYIIRGLPGSGKSTLAATLCGKDFHEADQYFVEPEGYRFNPAKLKEAHEWCRQSVAEDMKFGVTVIGVSNTFTQQWEMKPYLELAAEYGYEVFTITCENDFGNVHNVPAEAIERMAARFEPMHPVVRVLQKFDKPLIY